VKLSDGWFRFTSSNTPGVSFKPEVGPLVQPFKSLDGKAYVTRAQTATRNLMGG
jgi:hypothetical protein